MTPARSGRSPVRQGVAREVTAPRPQSWVRRVRAAFAVPAARRPSNLDRA